MKFKFLLNISIVILFTTESESGIGTNVCKKYGGHMDCTSRNFTSIPRKNSEGITAVDFSHNFFQNLTAYSFVAWKEITFLKLRFCSIRNISKNSFFGLENLLRLDISDNQLSVLAEDTFNGLFHLQYLDTTTNMFSKYGYPVDALAKITSLSELHIDLLNGNEFGDKLHALSNLKVLHLDTEFFTSILLTNSSFRGFANSPIQTLHIDASVTNLEAMTFSPFRKLRNFFLKTYFLCDIHKIMQSMYGLQNLTLDNVKIRDSGDFSLNAQVLQKNDALFLQNIKIKKFSIVNSYIRAATPQFIQLTSRCEIQHLDVSQNDIEIRDAGWINFWKNISSLNMSGKQKPVRIRKEVHNRSKQVKSSIKFIVPLPSSLEYVDLSYSNYRFPKIKMEFIAHGLKYLDVSHSHRFNCGKQATYSGMGNLEVFNISNIYCEDLKSDHLNFTELKVLIARNIHLRPRTDLSGVFKHLNKLREIDLSENNINMNASFLNIAAVTLKHLKLSATNLTYFPYFLVKDLKSLQALDLSQNEITNIGKDDLNYISKMGKSSNGTVQLSGSIVDCSCSEISMGFLKWLQYNQNYISDYDIIQCRLENQTIVALKTVVSQLKVYIKQCLSYFFLKLTLVLLFVVLFLLLFFAIMYKYKSYLQYSLLRIQHKLSGFQPVSKCKYDLFLCFGHQDSNWVRNELYDKLIENLNLNICVYDKDFPLASSIAENIVEALNDSRKVLFVITKSFLKSEWCIFEMDMAKVHIVEARGDPTKVIIVMKDRLKYSEMPPQLRWMWKRFVFLQWPTNDDFEENREEKISRQKQKAFRKICKALSDQRINVPLQPLNND